MGNYKNIVAIALFVLTFIPSVAGMVYGGFFLYSKKRWICSYLTMSTAGLGLILGFALWGALMRTLGTQDGMTSFFVMCASQWICVGLAWWSTKRTIRWLDHQREILRQEKALAKINTPPYAK